MMPPVSSLHVQNEYGSVMHEHDAHPFGSGKQRVEGGAPPAPGAW
jgi:hypothetical protein